MFEITQEDWDMAMNDLFDVLDKMPAEHKKEAYDTVGRSLFKEASNANTRKKG